METQNKPGILASGWKKRRYIMRLVAQTRAAVTRWARRAGTPNTNYDILDDPALRILTDQIRDSTWVRAGEVIPHVWY
jgi:hypothetical protein